MGVRLPLTTEPGRATRDASPIGGQMYPPDALPFPYQATRHCVFCATSDPQDQLLELANNSAVVRIDNYPATDGHLEVVPRRHVRLLRELNALELWDFAELMLKAYQTLSRQYHPDGFTVGINDGQAAGQSIPHLHMHLIPRYMGDVGLPPRGILRVLDERSRDYEIPTGLPPLICDNTTAVAELDARAVSPGHVCVTPRRTVHRLGELSLKEIWDILVLARTAQARISKAENPDAYTIGINDGEAAGQTCEQLHLHVIPRYLNDVPEPLGGIRRIFPDCNPTQWK